MANVPPGIHTMSRGPLRPSPMVSAAGSRRWYSYDAKAEPASVTASATAPARRRCRWVSFMSGLEKQCARFHDEGGRSGLLQGDLMAWRVFLEHLAIPLHFRHERHRDRNVANGDGLLLLRVAVQIEDERGPRRLQRAGEAAVVALPRDRIRHLHLLHQLEFVDAHGREFVVPEVEDAAPVRHALVGQQKR